MAKLRLAICLEDREYQNRFTNCIMNHYQNQFELHVFTAIEEFLEQQMEYFHGIILSGYEEKILLHSEKMPMNYIYLYDEDQGSFPSGGQALYIEKYSDVSQIMDAVWGYIREEAQTMGNLSCRAGKNGIVGVFGLARVEYQLPIAVTMAAVLSERERVLLLDLEANSGLSMLAGSEYSQGLEELLVMSESGKYSRSRMQGCIGKIDHLDYVYPVGDSERLSETEGSAIIRLLKLLSQELDYSIILVNMGTRIKGFLELMNESRKIFLLSRQDELAMWREKSFLQEVENSEYGLLWQRIQRVEVPEFRINMNEYERTVEQWKWSEMGDYIRKLVIQEDIFAKGSRDYPSTGFSTT